MSTSELGICDNCVATTVDAVNATSIVYGVLTDMREFGARGTLCDITYKLNQSERLIIFLCSGFQEHIIFSSRHV